MINNDANPFPRVGEVIQKSLSGSIILPQNPSSDAVSAACALYLALHKMGKSVSIACSSKVDVNVTASDKIQSQMVTSGDNLVVSFPYQEGAIDKVDYNIQGNAFNLIIAPRQGFPKLNPNEVKYSYTGGNLDFLIIIDSPTLQSLGQIYQDNEKQFQGKDIINIDRHLTNGYYGTINYVNKASSSISESILKLIQQLGIEIDRDMATNLYAGIAAATNNFTSYSVTADTFESIASLLRMGAMKKTIKRGNPQGYQPYGMGNPMNSQPPPYQPSPFGNDLRNVKPIDQVEKEPTGSGTPTPDDWLKPKIFKGGGGLV